VHSCWSFRSLQCGTQLSVRDAVQKLLWTLQLPLLCAKSHPVGHSGGPRSRKEMKPSLIRGSKLASQSVYGGSQSMGALTS